MTDGQSSLTWSLVMMHWTGLANLVGEGTFLRRNFKGWRETTRRKGRGKPAPGNKTGDKPYEIGDDVTVPPHMLTTT